VLLKFIQDSCGAATLLDVRRSQDYDASAIVDAYLNLPEVKASVALLLRLPT
jgi:hypothetical protein